jgi:hypothetical protein
MGKLSAIGYLDYTAPIVWISPSGAFKVVEMEIEIHSYSSSENP